MFDTVMTDDRRSCPFLVNSECSIYGARPVVCRSYFIESFNEDCLATDEVKSSFRSRQIRVWAEEKLMKLDYISHSMPLLYVVADIAAERYDIKSIYAF